jgi:nitrite reductase/ring-hydroxylating ferredoxin subunit
MDSPPFTEAFDQAALADNTMEIIELQGGKIALVKRFGKIYALDNTCPHLGGSLGRGTLKDNSVICPMHHWTYDLSTGKCINGVPDEKVSTYETKVENGKIWSNCPAQKVNNFITPKRL